MHLISALTQPSLKHLGFPPHEKDSNPSGQGQGSELPLGPQLSADADDATTRSTVTTIEKSAPRFALTLPAIILTILKCRIKI